jgi:DNA topoisomerase II
LNVREAAHNQIMENQEISHIKKILGLQHGKDYDSARSLRYGHLMVMADQDHDGSHIKGLIINFLDHFFPSLLRIPGFLLEFVTPIVKVLCARTTCVMGAGASLTPARQQATKSRQELSFFTIPEYEQWRDDHEGGKGWTIKYYKACARLMHASKLCAYTPRRLWGGPYRVWAPARPLRPRTTFRICRGTASRLPCAPSPSES